ncbi:hypothetical protein ABPG77_004996 [Micractinium sp. CCAP 211/92]
MLGICPSRCQRPEFRVRSLADEAMRAEVLLAAGLWLVLPARAAAELAGSIWHEEFLMPGYAGTGGAERRLHGTQGPAAAGAGLAGRVLIKLVGRGGCRERGYLGPQPCAAGPRGLALKSTGGGPFTTFILQEAGPGSGQYTIRSLGRSGPPFQGCASYLSSAGPASGCYNTTVSMSRTAQRWKLIAVPGKRNTFLIRPALRPPLCAPRYLGARKPLPGAKQDCGPSAVALYDPLQGQALTEWELEALPPPRPPPRPHKPPVGPAQSPHPPPPHPQPPKPSPPPPRPRPPMPSPPPPPRPSPPPPSPSPPPPSPSPPPPSPSPPPPSPSPPPPSPSPPPPSPPPPLPNCQAIDMGAYNLVTSYNPHTQLAAAGAPDAVALLFRAPGADSPSFPSCAAYLQQMQFAMCTQVNGGGFAFGISINPLDAAGNPDLGTTLYSTLFDEVVFMAVCGNGRYTVWTIPEGPLLSPGGAYAFVLTSPVPTSGAQVPWWWLTSGNNDAPSPADLFIGYKELNGGVWSSHTPNNWVKLTFG